MTTFVSIILPVRNEEKYITTCLQSIIAQDYPTDSMEVLIIDGRSADSTFVKITEFKKTNPQSNIKILDNPKRSVSAGLNIGFKAAKGDILLRMDAHAGYGRDYIKQCLAVLEKTGAANVGGPALALPGDDTAMAQTIALAHKSPFGLGGGAFRNPNAGGWVETVWPGCYKKEVFAKAGYIDERRTRTEDIEFNSRLLAAGYRIYLSPLIKAWYYCRTTLGETWRQRWADGYEITRFLPDNPKAPRLRHFIPLVFVTSLIILTALAVFLRPELSPVEKIATYFRSAVGLKNPTWPYVFKFNYWNLKLVAIRLLLLELLAYLAAMLFFVGQAGRNLQRTAYSKQGTANGEEIKTFEAIGGPGETKGQPNNSEFIIRNSKFSFGSLALLPVVFLTLHFSYGLGSIWGLISLPYWAARKQKR